MDIVEAAVAEDTEDVAGLGLEGDVRNDLICSGEVICLGANGPDVGHELGGVESFLGGDLLETRDFGDDHALGQAEGLG